MTGYSNWIVSITELMAGIDVDDANSATPTTDDNFNAIYPSIIADAEGMMYRDPDLDFLQTRSTDSSAVTVSGTRTLTIPAQFLIAEQAILITPAGATTANGTRVNLSRVSVEWLNDVYPVQTFTGTPVYGESYYAIFNGSQIIIAPTPNGAYTAEFYGVVSQTPLSATNTATILTNFYPDLFLAASMIFASGFQKNFSATGDNPEQPMSWDKHYQDLKKGAAFQSARQKFLARGAYPPATIATTIKAS